jgi:hypothetical protein
MNDLIVAFRTHYWNDTVAMLARRVRGAIGNTLMVVLADESSNVIEIPNFNKLSHTSDFSEFRLPEIPLGKSLWFNGDYPLYLLRKRYPNYRYYVMIENDVAVNSDLVPFFNKIQRDDIKFVASDFSRRSHNWDFFESAGHHFDKIYGCLMPFVVVSADLIDGLYNKRLEIRDQISRNPSISWPFCEAFIASFVAQFSLGSAFDLRDFFYMPYFVFKPAIHIGNPWANLPNWITHPVLSGSQFVQKRLLEDKIEDVFDRSSKIYDEFRYCHKEELYKPLYDLVKKAKSQELYRKYLAYLEERGFNDHGFD